MVNCMTDKQNKIAMDEISEKKAIYEFLGNTSEGFFVEIGANEPDAPESQTWHLEQKGWKGILVEPIPELADKAKKIRVASKVYQVACTSENNIGKLEFLIPFNGEDLVSGHASLRANIDEHNYTKFKKLQVNAVTLNSILDAENINSIDFLSIDVEGAELEVLEGLDLNRFRPKLILLEDKHLYLSKHFYLTKFKYRLAQRVNRNCWYIPVGEQGPSVTLWQKFKLFKRMYVSIWLRKLQYAIRHKTIESFKKI